VSPACSSAALRARLVSGERGWPAAVSCVPGWVLVSALLVLSCAQRCGCDDNGGAVLEEANRLLSSPLARREGLSRPDPTETELARAHWWQLDKLERLLDDLDGLGPIDSPSPGNSVEAVIDDLIPLAAHCSQIVQGDLTGTGAAPRGDDSAPGNDVELRFRIHLTLLS